MPFSQLNYVDKSRDNNQLRYRQNALLVQQQPNYFQYGNPYTMQHQPDDFNLNSGYCGNPGLIQLHSPGLKEVLASHIPGPTVLYMEPKKKKNRSFKLNIFIVILILTFLGILIFGTSFLFKTEDKGNNVKIIYSRDDDEEAILETVYD